MRLRIAKKNWIELVFRRRQSFNDEWQIKISSFTYILNTKLLLMYKNFDEFLEYLGLKIAHEGSVGFASAISEFFKMAPTNAFIEDVLGRLRATGKYRVERHESSGSMLIRLDPNYEAYEHIRKTSKLQRAVLRIIVIVSILTLVLTGLNTYFTLHYQDKRLSTQATEQSPLPQTTIDSGP